MTQPDSIVLRKTDQGMSLIDYLARERACSQRQAKNLLDQRVVFVNNRRVWMAKHKLVAGDRITIVSSVSTRPKEWRPEVLYEDADAWVINKPAGMVSVGPDSVESRLQQLWSDQYVRVAHRLDRETTGCLCVARSAAGFDRMVEAFATQRVVKLYDVLVMGIPRQASGTIRHKLDRQTAISHWHCMASHRSVSHLQVRIETGRTHQIRRHLAAAGLPVLGDRHYLTVALADERFQRVPRQMLHATHFSIRPIAELDGRLSATAPWPADFRDVMRRFGLKRSRRTGK